MTDLSVTATDVCNRLAVEALLESEERPTPRRVEIVVPDDEPVRILIAEE